MTVLTARRALGRWSWRMFRREWRQQVLVLTLLTIAVAAAIASITIVYNTAPADDAKHGSADSLLRLDGSDPLALAAGLAAARERFGTIDLIAQRWFTVPGGVERVLYRGLDPDGPYVRDIVSVRRGQYPQRGDEVAVTDGVAELMRLEIGSSLALDGRRRIVVGIVENPRKLSEEFALVTPSSAPAPQSVTILVDADETSIPSFFRSLDDRPAFMGSEPRPTERRADTLAMFSVATVFLLLASLVAAAGFAVIAQRRLRHLGMLAAVGATQKHLRLAVMANGVIIGTIGALLGTAVGLILWVAAAPTLESATDHRIDRLSLPWDLIAGTALLAVLGATAAAWWPGRAAARLPVVLALSGRPPKPRPARHAAIAAVVLIAIGIGCLALSNRERTSLIIAGIVATILGCLMLGPLAIRIISRVAGRAPIAPRLALRDLVRYQARSGAALAAVTLALGITAAVVIVSSAEAAKRNAEPPNLSDRQIRVHLGAWEDRESTPVDALGRFDELDARVRRLATALDDATVVPLRKAVEPGAPRVVVPDTESQVIVTVDLTRQVRPKLFNLASKLYVATPAVLRYLGIDPATVDRRTDFLAYPDVETDELVIPPIGRRSRVRTRAVTNVERIETRHRLPGSFSFGSNDFDEYTAPTSPTFITLDGLRRRGWRQVPSTWLVESGRSLTSDQIADAREIAADAGFTIELRRERTTYARTIVIATSAGALLALAILALTVGLIRSESAGDLRTLTATGATAAIRRTLTATTAGALALLGALLGVAGAYIVMTATYHDDLGYLSDVPVLYLLLAVVGVPVAATAAGWLLAGREPPAIARAAIE